MGGGADESRPCACNARRTRERHGAARRGLAAYRAALEEWTRERVPLDWAKSFGNRGVALILIAERTGDGAMARAALDQITAAAKTAREGGDAPSADYFEAQLPKAQSLVEHLAEAAPKKASARP